MGTREFKNQSPLVRSPAPWRWGSDEYGTRTLLDAKGEWVLGSGAELDDNDVRCHSEVDQALIENAPEMQDLLIAARNYADATRRFYEPDPLIGKIDSLLAKLR